MVQTLPMACFCQATQKYAIGTCQGPVFIYDLRTATRWRVLEGGEHGAAVAACAFTD